MSRSGYYDDCENNWEWIKWRGMVASAIRGKRGQRLLRDLVAALEGLPTKKLITSELITEEGEVCALGSVGKLRGLEMADTDPEDSTRVASMFDIAECLERDIVYENDEGGYSNETPEDRFERIYAWAKGHLK